MAVRSRDTIKNWFRTGLKPLQSHFWDWLDSFLHKTDKIPSENINWAADPYNVQSDLAQDDDTKADHVKSRQLANLQGDADHRTVTDTEKSTWNGKQDALGFTPEDAANKGIASGYASLDSNALVPVSQLPATVKESKVVADIAARDALTPYESLRAHVIDATADSTVDSGGAGYIHDGSAWQKTYEEEGLDAAVDWSNISNKPTSSTSEIDDSVTKKHTQGTDQALDTGGANEVTAAQAKGAYDHSQATHAPTDAEANVQGDLGQTNSEADDFIKNKLLANLTGDANNRTVTETEKSTWNGKQDALSFTPEDSANKGIASGYASLDSNALVPVSQLPATVKESKVVADIAARDALTPYEGLRAHVIDATADSTVGSGGAGYIYDGASWVKTYEEEGLDAAVDWSNISNKPSDLTDLSTHSADEMSDVPTASGGQALIRGASAYEAKQVEGKETLSGTTIDLSASYQDIEKACAGANITIDFSALKTGVMRIVTLSNCNSLAFSGVTSSLKGDTIGGTKDRLMIHCISDVSGSEEIIAINQDIS